MGAYSVFRCREVTASSKRAKIFDVITTGIYFLKLKHSGSVCSKSAVVESLTCVDVGYRIQRSALTSRVKTRHTLIMHFYSNLRHPVGNEELANNKRRRFDRKRYWVHLFFYFSDRLPLENFIALSMMLVKTKRNVYFMKRTFFSATDQMWINIEKRATNI